MKKIVFFCFILITATTVFSQSKCDFDKCLEHCINHKKICSIWEKGEVMNVYHEVYAINSFTIFDKIKVGSSVTFPPFERGNQVIGTKTVLTVRNNEDIWAIIHRYKKENYLFNLNLDYRGVNNDWAKKTGLKELAFGSTKIYW